MLIVVLLVLLAASAYGLRAAGGEPRWPFVLASALSGAAFLALLTATVVALSAGRDTWNGWVSGSGLSETVTLWLLLVALPVLLATCCALLMTGLVLRIRQRRHEQGSSR